jgi:hypothetical protein
MEGMSEGVIKGVCNGMIKGGRVIFGMLERISSCVLR